MAKTETRGRKQMYTADEQVRIGKLVKKYGASKTRDILAMPKSPVGLKKDAKKLWNIRKQAGLGKVAKAATIPVIARIGRENGAKLKRGRPVKTA